MTQQVGSFGYLHTQLSQEAAGEAVGTEGVGARGCPHLRSHVSSGVFQSPVWQLLHMQ